MHDQKQDKQTILYVSGDPGEERYLLSAGSQAPGPGNDHEIALGVVLDTANKTLSLPLSLVTILGQGYWNEYKGEQAILPGLLKSIGHVTEEPVW